MKQDLSDGSIGFELVVDSMLGLLASGARTLDKHRGPSSHMTLWNLLLVRICTVLVRRSRPTDDFRPPFKVCMPPLKEQCARQ